MFEAVKARQRCQISFGVIGTALLVATACADTSDTTATQDRLNPMIALHELLSGSVTTPSRHAARNEAKAAMEKAIEILPEVYRKVVTWYDLEGRSSQEVAAALSRSRGAVAMLRARALAKLRDILKSRSDYLSSST